MRRKYLQEYDLAAHFGPLADRKRVLYERRLRRIGPPAGGRRLCDLGCGDGQFLALAKQRGWDASGVEMNPAAAERAEERGATIYRGLVEEVRGVPAASFDLVTAWDSIEHTPDPIAFLCRARDLLRADGLLAVTTLNVDSAVARAFRDRWSMYVEDHFTYWSGRALTAALERAGFAVTSRWGAGIGRDFANLAGRLRRPGHRPSAHGAPKPGLDSSPLLTGVEDRINLALGALNLGVEGGVLAQPARR